MCAKSWKWKSARTEARRIPVPVPTNGIRLPKTPCKAEKKRQGDACYSQADAVDEGKNKADDELSPQKMPEIVIYLR